MYFIQFLKSLIRGVLRFVRSLTTLLWRVSFSNLRLRYIRQINMKLDDECDLDSTWEDECENKEPRKKIYRRSDRNMYAAKDMQDFRHSVRNLDDDDDDDDEPGEGHFYNLEFYHGEINSSPDDVHIDEFHQEWWGDYRLLESCHSYIQWLFPIQEQGVNWDAHVLTKKEIKAFRKDKEAKRKLVKSYKLMLDFYGIRLANETTGEVERANNWRERFSNLNRYSHNNLRITRILKCLGTLGLQHYQAPLVKFFLHETLVEGRLQSVKQSVLDYFMFAVLDKSKRQELVRFAFKNFKPREQFVWGPKKFLSGEVEEDEQDPDESVKKNQKVSVGDAKKLEEVHSENENFGIENRAAEDGQQRETSERTVETGSDKNNKDEQDPDKNSSNNKKAEKQDQETSNDSNEEHSKPQENWVKPHESTDEMNKIDANHPPEGMGSETPSKKNHQNIDKPDTPNKMTGDIIESDQGANEDSQCCSENKSGKENLEMIVGDDDDGDDGSKKFLSGEVHSKNETFSQLTENKDNSTHDGNQIDASNHVKGMLNEENGGKDHQVKTGSNKNNEDEHDTNENSQCSSNNKTAEKQDPETNDSNED